MSRNTYRTGPLDSDMSHDDIHDLQLEIDMLRQRVEHLESLVNLATQVMSKRFGSNPLFRKVVKAYASINDSASGIRDLRSRTLVS